MKKIIYTDNNIRPQNPGETIISKGVFDKNFGGLGKIQNVKIKNLAKTKNVFAHVFWSKPTLMENVRWEIKNQYELTLPLCALSLACLKAHGQEVVLITDKAGKELLQDLPYDGIYTIFDDYNINSDFWAAGKIIALDHLAPHITLIDTDLFLYDGNLIDKINENDVLCSHIESTRAYSDLLQFGSVILPWMNKLDNWKFSSNTGILKCNNTNLKTMFISSYFETIDIINKQNLMSTIKSFGQGTYCPDLLAEQFNYYTLCNPVALINLPTQFIEVEGFSHPLAFEKYLHMPLIMDLLKNDFSEYYDIVMNKWKELEFEIIVEGSLYEN